MVTNNSFWNKQGVKAGDIIKSIDGTEISMQNANQVFQEVYMWQPGKEIKVVLKRGGEEVIIETVLTQSFTTGQMLQESTTALSVSFLYNRTV